MPLYTSQIYDQTVDELDTSTAINVPMDGIKVMAYDDDDRGDTLMYTEGVGPCIAIVVNGAVAKEPSDEPPQKFIAMYHWSGGTEDQINNLPSHLNVRQKGVILAFKGLTDLVAEIKSELCDDQGEEYVSYKVTLNDIAVLGGERQQEHLSGTEMQVRGLFDALNNDPFKAKFLERTHTALPNLTQNNLQAFHASNERDMDVYVVLDENGQLQTQFHMRDTVTHKIGHQQEDELTEHEEQAVHILTNLKHS